MCFGNDLVNERLLGVFFSIGLLGLPKEILLFWWSEKLLYSGIKNFKETLTFIYSQEDYLCPVPTKETSKIIPFPRKIRTSKKTTIANKNIFFGLMQV